MEIDKSIKWHLINYSKKKKQQHRYKKSNYFTERKNIYSYKTKYSTEILIKHY